MGFSNNGSQGGQYSYVVVRLSTLKDVKLAPNGTLDSVVAARITPCPLPLDRPVAVIDDLEANARSGFMMKNAVVHRGRQDV